MKTTEYPSSLTEAQFEQIKPCLNAQRRSKWNLLNIVNAILYVCDGGVKWRKDYFVFGCTAALRYSDLMNLSVHDVECRSGRYFLVYRSIKTDTPVSIKLPDYAVSIYQSYASGKQSHQKLFPYLAKPNFNKHLQRIGSMAGWTDFIGKYRTRNGRALELKKGTALFRFCDHLSTHTMRRTGITLLLMMGMPEFLVRKVSGHAAHSRSFSRYVHLAQSFISEEITKAHQRLLSNYPS